MANPRAFVIMPFDSEFDAVYSDLIAAPLRAAGFEVSRADNVTSRQNVLADIVRNIADGDLVVADLTTANANVFYELGLAHALNIPTVLIAHRDSAGDIPFDLRQYRTEFYDTHFQRAKSIVDALSELGKRHIAGEIEFSSPIADFLPGAIKPSAARLRSEHRRNDSGLAPPAVQPFEDELGLFDYLDTMVEASATLTLALDPINECVVDIGNRMEGLALRTSEIDMSEAGAQAMLRHLVIESADSLEAFASQLESYLPDLEGSVDGVTSGGLGYLTLLASDPVANAGALQSSLDTARSLNETVVLASAHVQEMRDAIAGLPPMIKELRRAQSHAVRAVDSELAQLDRVRSYAEQSAALASAALA